MVKKYKDPKAIKKRLRKPFPADTIEDPQPAHKYFNLQMILKTTRLNPDKVYNNFKGAYNSLSPEEKKQIATALMIPTKEMFARLGMDVSFSKLADAS